MAEHNIDFVYHGLALVNALALGKVVLVAGGLHVGEHDGRLIYPTLLKSALFTVVLACFKILEDAIIAWHRGQPFQQSIADLGGGTWKGVLTIMFLVSCCWSRLSDSGSSQGLLARVSCRNCSFTALLWKTMREIHDASHLLNRKNVSRY